MPELARSASSGAWRRFGNLSTRRLILVLTLAAGSYVVCVAIVSVAIRLFDVGGHLSVTQASLLAALVIALGGVLLGGVSGQMSTTSFFALGNTVTPTKVGVIGFALGVPLKVLLFWKWGVLGLAVGTSLYYLGNAVAHQTLLHYEVRRRLAWSRSES